MIELRHRPDVALLRRLLTLGATLAGVAGATALLLDIVSANGTTIGEWILVILFVPCFAWISISFWTAIAGFVIILLQLHPVTLRRETSLPALPLGLASRIAILVPIYNEEVERVFARLARNFNAIARTRYADSFDFFVLSDTRDDSVRDAEECAWLAACNEWHASGRLFYRNRASNVGRKAGNIADWVRQWGGAYESMIILDADSTMDGDAMIGLAALMERNREVGIIQTLSLITGQRTIFGAALQFAHRLYSPLLAVGASFWQLGESNYFGHNAILRVRAFAENCGLGPLSGPAPLGGDVLSHDFVEAACMRRGGWSVWCLPDIGGSYEEMPSNLIDFAARDRRWMQGNLQHLRMLSTAGFHWVSRAHFVTGAASFLMATVWLLLLAGASALELERASSLHSYFPAAHVLFPQWPESRHAEILVLLTVTLTVLLAPRGLAILAALSRGAVRRQFGGALRLIFSALLETSFSMLIAPAMMIFHSRFAMQILTRRSVAWGGQPRGVAAIEWVRATRLQWLSTALGLGWAALLLVVAPQFLLWVAPVVIGLCLSIPLTRLTSIPSRLALAIWRDIDHLRGAEHPRFERPRAATIQGSQP